MEYMIHVLLYNCISSSNNHIFNYLIKLSSYTFKQECTTVDSDWFQTFSCFNEHWFFYQVSVILNSQNWNFYSKFIGELFKAIKHIEGEHLR